MTNLISDISKYLLILLITIYTYWNFRYFDVGESKKEKIYKQQNRLMLLIHFVAFAVMFLRTEDLKLLIFYGIQVAFLISYLFLYSKIYRYRARLLMSNLSLLICVGFIILTRLSFDKAVRQFVIILFSAIVTWIIPFFIGRVWQLCRIPWIYGIGGVALLGMVWIAGDSSYGAQLSFHMEPFSMQPSEFVKITFVFFVASMFHLSIDKKQILKATIVAALHVLILAASKDLGGAFIFFVTYLFMLFIATSKWRYLILGTISGCMASVIAWKLFAHVRVRVMAWQNPWADIDNRGYQITQSLFAIGTGSWFGMGLYQGMPKRIPVVEKDFVLAAISEEMGAIFAFCVLLICLGCFIQFMMIACQMESMFYKLIALGLGTVYIVQVFLTAGGVTKFIPSTGVTLPFISYGGSSILSTFILFSVIQGLYILKQKGLQESYEGSF